MAINRSEALDGAIDKIATVSKRDVEFVRQVITRMASAGASEKMLANDYAQGYIAGVLRKEDVTANEIADALMSPVAFMNFRGA